MTFRFRRSLNLFPGIKLNINKASPSLTVGERGAHLTIGKRGAAVGAGIPGSGMSLRERLPLKLHEVATQKPRFWEFILLQRGLSIILENANPVWLEAKEAGMDPASFCFWITNRIEQLETDAEKLKQYLTTDLSEALGPPGQQGSEEKLCAVLESVAQLTEELIGWEHEVKSFSSHPLYGDLANALSGFSKPLLDAITELEQKLDSQIPGLQKGGNLDLTFTVQAPDGSDELQEKLKAFSQHSWADWKKENSLAFKIARGDTQLGLFSSTTIHENLLAGIFLPDDWFWSESLNDWKALNEFDDR